MFLKAGSELKLHCVVNLGGQGPDEHFSETAVLHWFLGQRLIDSTLSKEKEKGVSTKTKLLDHLEVRKYIFPLNFTLSSYDIQGVPIKMLQ